MCVVPSRGGLCTFAEGTVYFASTRPSRDACINESVVPRLDGGLLSDSNLVVVDRRRTWSRLATGRGRSACSLASNCGRATVDEDSVMPSYGKMQRVKGRSSWTRRCGSWSVRGLWERVGSSRPREDRVADQIRAGNQTRRRRRARAPCHSILFLNSSELAHRHRQLFGLSD